jgi:hypothetical protein
MSTRAERVLDRVAVGFGLCVWAAFGLMFVEEGHPALRVYVTWTFRIYAGTILAFLAGAILFEVFIGARETVSKYQTVSHRGRAGIVGRVMWAFFFLLTFLIALARARF